MPQNTVAGKATIGPANASDKEIINVLTPQAELAAANAKIKRLREQLKTRNTPTFSDNLLDRLATVLKALAQRTALLQSAKVADPPLLTDGVDPTFNNQKLQLQDKLKVNVDYFPTT